MLRTRAPLVVAHPFDLHVLGPPQTFALSQDQTLQFELVLSIHLAVLLGVVDQRDLT